VCVTPLDTFAPKTPDDVFAVTSSGGILLSWREADASDLAGYRVYRAERSEGPYELMTPEPIRLGSFMDRNVEPGVEYHYKVSAVDRAEPENESPQSASESARASEP
jgi:fibronectin type 3 domain-containing protein